MHFMRQTDSLSFVSRYFNNGFHFTAISLFFSLIFIKKSNYNISLINSLLFLGCLCFSILFYAQFIDHDYYFLICIPFITLTLINGMKTLININLSEKYHRFFKAIFSSCFGWDKSFKTQTHRKV